MSVTRGNKHNFVGMNFELTKNGEGEIIMWDYLEECIKTFEEVFNGGDKDPSTGELVRIVGRGRKTDRREGGNIPSCGSKVTVHGKKGQAGYRPGNLLFMWLDRQEHYQRLGKVEAAFTLLEWDLGYGQTNRNER